MEQTNKIQETKTEHSNKYTQKDSREYAVSEQEQEFAKTANIFIGKQTYECNYNSTEGLNKIFDMTEDSFSNAGEEVQEVSQGNAPKKLK